MRFSVDKTENKKQDFWVTFFLFLLLYLLWLDESWLSSMRIFAAASRVTVCVLDTRKSMTNFWLMMRRDLSFLLPPATDNRERRKYVRVMQSNKSTMKEIGVPRFSSSNDYIQFTLPMLDWSVFWSSRWPLLNPRWNCTLKVKMEVPLQPPQMRKINCLNSENKSQICTLKSSNATFVVSISTFQPFIWYHLRVHILWTSLFPTCLPMLK